jgi:O-antigen/teichoic acid export membrane protein
VILALFSADYLPATAVLGVLLGTMVVAVLTGLHGQTLIALGKPGQVTAINIATAGLSLGLNGALIPAWGLAGAAASALVAAVASYTLQAAAVRRAGVVVSPWRSLWPVVLAGAAGLGLGVAGAPVALRALALAGVVVGLLATGALRREDLRGLWPGR